MKKKHVEMMRHLERFIDRKRFPDYTLTASDFFDYLKVESTGKGVRNDALQWAKQVEEITIQQMWHEMAEAWASGFGWWCIWRDNLSRAWADRRGNNIMVRKILAQARLIKRCGSFISAMLKCSYFSTEDTVRYRDRWTTYNKSK